jgi:hypothetical protein
MTKADDGREGIDPGERTKQLVDDLRPYLQFESATTEEDFGRILFGATPLDLGLHLAGVEIGRAHFDFAAVFAMVLRSMIKGGADLTVEEFRERLKLAITQSENLPRVRDVMSLLSYMVRRAPAKLDSAIRELYMEGRLYTQLPAAPAAARSEKAIRRRVSDIRAQESAAAVARLTDPSRVVGSTRQGKARGHKSEWDAVSLELAIRTAVNSLRPRRDAKIDYDSVAEKIRKQTKKSTPGTGESLRKMVKDFGLDWKALKNGV